MTPLRFCFGLHLHQPVGNFDHVFESHVRDVYLPFLDAVEASGFFPLSLHVSGPLVDWLEANDRRYLDRIGRLSADGSIELLGAGYDEPILAALPRADRSEQLGLMRNRLQSLFGAGMDGVWLTERVWEPDLASDLAEAGVRFALVDDRHFLATGFERGALHGHYVTEHDGRRVSLFPIDERLRYLIPFQPAQETVDYFDKLQNDGKGVAVLADDGEKFGGWPGTAEWVFGKKWLQSFMSAVEAAAARGIVQLSTFSEAHRLTESLGLAYLPTASYREMEAWSLPAPAALALDALEKKIAGSRPGDMETDAGALVRGGHWRNFLVRYPESNRMHKKMIAVSSLCRARGNPPGPRRSIGRAQCNDAYWHGVFGGLYLPFLRAAIWKQLAAAEGELRRGEAIVLEEVDIDFDGRSELWIHCEDWSAIVAPHRGGSVEELSRFGSGENLADTLTRRREASHILAMQARASGEGSASSDNEATALDAGSAASIHEIEREQTLTALPPVDRETRALFSERILPADVSPDGFARGEYTVIRSFAGTALQLQGSHVDATTARISLSTSDGVLDKELTFFRDGRVRATFRWRLGSAPPGCWLTSELSLNRNHEVVASSGATIWTHEIETIARSERGFDRTLQGVSCLVRFPFAAGTGWVEISGEVTDSLPGNEQKTRHR
ncbi:MAG: alpha-amylase/4-alpha-glucanotransferase domain-containing protein [Gemmatimonadota bacterium]